MDTFNDTINVNAIETNKNAIEVANNAIVKALEITTIEYLKAEENANTKLNRSVYVAQNAFVAYSDYIKIAHSEDITIANTECTNAGVNINNARTTYNDAVNIADSAQLDANNAVNIVNALNVDLNSAIILVEKLNIEIIEINKLIDTAWTKADNSESEFSNAYYNASNTVNCANNKRIESEQATSVLSRINIKIANARLEALKLTALYDIVNKKQLKAKKDLRMVNIAYNKTVLNVKTTYIIDATFVVNSSTNYNSSYFKAAKKLCDTEYESDKAKFYSDVAVNKKKELSGKLQSLRNIISELARIA